MSSTKTLSAQFTKAAGTGGRKFTATITTDAIDRDGEVVIPGGMNSKEYETNPVLLYEHDVLKPIGKMVDMRRGDRSIEATFALAPRPDGHEGEWLPDTVGALMEFGALNAMSIGFSGMEARPATKSDLEKFGAGVRRVYSKWKLLEVSVVALPANQDAIINAVSKGLISRDRAKAMGVTVPEAKNCGVGSEGFEEGNTCAGGGGGAGGGSKPDMPGLRDKPRNADIPPTTSPKLPDKPRTPPKKGSAGEQFGKPPAAGLDPPGNYVNIPLPRDPSRITTGVYDFALNDLGYENMGERVDPKTRRTIGVYLRDRSGNVVEAAPRDVLQAIYGNSIIPSDRDIRVPVKRPKKAHYIAITVPALGTDDLARITREELARQRGLLYIR